MLSRRADARPCSWAVPRQPPSAEQLAAAFESPASPANRRPPTPAPPANSGNPGPVQQTPGQRPQPTTTHKTTRRRNTGPGNTAKPRGRSHALFGITIQLKRVVDPAAPAEAVTAAPTQGGGRFEVGNDRAEIPQAGAEANHQGPGQSRQTSSARHRPPGNSATMDPSSRNLSPRQRP